MVDFEIQHEIDAKMFTGSKKLDAILLNTDKVTCIYGKLVDQYEFTYFSRELVEFVPTSEENENTDFEEGINY